MLRCAGRSRDGNKENKRPSKVVVEEEKEAAASKRRRHKAKCSEETDLDGR